MTDTQLPASFGFTQTDDFQLFWEFALKTDPKEPQYAFNDTTMISLVGPFDLLAGRFDNEKAKFDPCLHWRYFGDPPEFVTTLVGGSDGLHWGYVVDGQAGPPQGIAGYYAYDDVSVFPEPSSLFRLLWNTLESTLSQIAEDKENDPSLAKDEDTIEHEKRCRQLLDSIDSFCSTQQLKFPKKITKLRFIDDCNPPAPFDFPEPEDFDALPALVEQGLELLASDGFSDVDARLKIGRLLWHWHYDGNPQLEEIAFGLLDAAYESQQSDFLRHVLKEHRQHRHRESLDVFSD